MNDEQMESAMQETVFNNYRADQAAAIHDLLTEMDKADIHDQAALSREWQQRGRALGVDDVFGALEEMRKQRKFQTGQPLPF